jgi:hypothetical protein
VIFRSPPPLIVFSLQDETAENINRLVERFLPEVESQLGGRALARAAVVERGIRAIEVSRYLEVSRAAIRAQLRARDTWRFNYVSSPGPPPLSPSLRLPHPTGVSP